MMEPLPIRSIIAEFGPRIPNVRAIALAGSRCIPDCPGANEGDWDFYAITDQQGRPGASERMAVWMNDDCPLAPYAYVAEGCNDRFSGPNLYMEFEYIPFAHLRYVVDRVMAGDVTRQGSNWCPMGECFETMCADLHNCKIIWDPDGVLSEFKQRLVAYPDVFRVSMLYQGVIELRVRLSLLKRACELDDMGSFHMGVSECSFTLMRMMFALNRVYFRGAKRGLYGLGKLTNLPAACARRLQDILGAPIAPGKMRETYQNMKRLLEDAIETGMTLDDAARDALENGLAWDYPDGMLLDAKPPR